MFPAYFKTIRWILAALAGTLWCAAAAFGSAATALQEIDDTVAHIYSEAAAIRQLGDQNQMETAYARLSVLNVYIQDRLVSVFYDRVQEVRREQPGYVPPVVAIDLGARFTEAFWDARVAAVEKAYKDAEDGLRGLSAQRTLDAQDSAWAYLGAVKAAFDSVKDIVKDALSLNAVGVAWDLYQATNTLTEQYTAIAAAKQAGLETSAYEAQVRLLISKTNKNLTRMKDFKSALIVNNWEVRAFAFNLKNIASFTGHAVRDPAFPLDFNDSRYNFIAKPYLDALEDAADELNDPADASCWAAFERSHQSIQAEALAEKTAIQANIDAFGGEKAIYQNDLVVAWGYFIDNAAGIYDPLAADRAAAQTDYNQLIAALAAAQAARDAHLALFADDTGLTPAALRTFEEADHGIVQMTYDTLFTPGDPYVAGRWYNPAFPASPGAVTAQMPAQSPALTGFGFDAYPEALTDLAGAYRNMAQAGLSRGAALTFTDGSPTGYFAASPLDAGLMADVDYDLTLLRSQALDFEAYMAAKTPMLDDAESAHQQVLTALQALVDHVATNRKLLCMDPESIGDDAVRYWENHVTPARVSAWSFRDGVDTAVDAIDGHLAYIQGQKNLNDAIAAATDLAADLQANGALVLLMARIIGQYQSLPALPSEDGYERFLRDLDQLHAFFGPAQIDRVMDRRDEAIALFKKVHTGAPAHYVGTLKTLIRWFKTENPYCVMPEPLETFQDLIKYVGVWDDSYNDLARAGFPGWDAWARARLAADWPDTATDAIRPSVVSRTPGQGSTAVALYQSVRVRFDEAMAPETLTKDTVTVTANGLPRQAVMTYDAARYELVLGLGRLLPETVYSVALSDGATDPAGNPLVPAAWSFTTTAPPAAGLVHIDITGVADGGSYADAVDIGISVSAGSYTAWLARNDEPAQPAVDGQSVTLRGRYRLTVTATGGLTRTLTFSMGGDGTGDALNEASLVSMATRTYTLVGHYRVDGNRYFYVLGTKVYMDDLLTGESRTLFDSGYYYDGITEVNNSELNEYAGFLDVHDRYVLFYKNVGTEGAGVPPEDKTFRLFVYDLETGKTIDVPVAAGVSITDGRLRDGAVVWIDASGASPVIYRWPIGGGLPETVQVLTGLETYQVPRLFAFDGEWIVYSLDDNGAAVCENRDTSTAVYEYCLPRGDTLLAMNALTGLARTLAAGTAAHPIQVGSAAAVRGLAGFVVYEMHKDLVGGFMTPFSDAAWLYLTDMTTGAVLELSTQPEVRRPVEMSGSLLYFVDRVSGGAYNLYGVQWFSQIQAKVHDLFSHRTQPVVFGDDPGLLNDVHLFGDRLVTDHNPPRVLFYGRPLSPVTVVGRFPADGATDAAAGAPITATFSGPMDPAALTSETVALTRIDAAGAFVERVPLAISYDGATDVLTLTPVVPLASGARYRVFLDGAASDAEGRALLKPVFWTFATADTQAPRLMATVPAEGSASLVPGTRILLIFDEPINDPAAGAVHLTVNGSSVETTSSAYGSDVLYISPNAPFVLPFGADCTLQVDPVVTDTADNAMAAGISFAFRTVAAGTAAYPLRMVYGGMSGASEMEGSGPATVISTDAAGSTTFRFDPTGERIFHTTAMNDLYVMDRDGANRSLIDSGVPSQTRVGFTADGGRVLYTRQWLDPAGYQIVTNALSGGDAQVIYTTAEGTIPLAAMSPDGSHIAFVLIGYDQPVRLGVLDLATQAVTYADGWTQPVWSIDGSRLFAREASGTRVPLAVFAPDLSSHQPVATIGAGDLYREPGGDRIAVLMGDGVELADPDTGSVRRLLDVFMAGMPGMGMPHLSWSRDGARFWVPIMGSVGLAEIVAFDRVAGTLATVAVGEGMPAMPFDAYETPTGPVDLVRPTITDLSDAAAPRIRIDWSGFSPPAGLTGYRVYRSEAPVDFIAEMTLLTNTADTVFDDTTVAVMTPYYYAVVAVTAAGAPAAAPLTGPVTAGDNDGLDDGWEMHWFGNLSAAADGDGDSDGVPNAEERREGTNPLVVDTDGDGASDAAELARGFDPLSADAALLAATAPPEVVIGVDVALVVTGGSGEYAFQVSDPALAAVTADGTFSGLTPGVVTVTVTDTVYTALTAVTVTVSVVDAAFGILPAGATLSLQPGGVLNLSAVGGSGAYLWSVSDTVVVSADMTGALLTLTAREPAGGFQVVLTDAVRTELAPVAVDVTIENVPGDITGDSRVDLGDAVTALQVTTGAGTAAPVTLNGDVDANGAIGLPEAIYPLRVLSE